MKKVSIICLSEEKRKSITELARIGLVHVATTSMADSEERAKLLKEIELVSRALSIISSSKITKISPVEAQMQALSPLAKTEKIISLADENANFAKDIASIGARIEKLSTWGNFTPSDIVTLKEKGVYVYFCEKNKNDDFKVPKDLFIKTISEDKNKKRFLLISLENIDESTLPIADLDFSKSLSQLISEMENLKAKIAENNAKIAEMKIFSDELKKYLAELKEKLQLAEAVDSMKGRGTLLCLTGYMPSADENIIRKAAQKNGWGLLIENASPEDRFVPTKIELPKIFQIVRPIFDFIGIEPGYDEVDVSVCFLFFFSIFFAMLIGDAGYGVLFLLFAIFAKIKFKNRADLKLPLNLFVHLSLCTIIWGALGGAWFSINYDKLPHPMRGIELLSNQETKDKIIQTFCFLLAAMHLSTGRIWRAIVLNNKKSFGQIGWVFMIWMNFFAIKGLLVDGGNLQAIVILTLAAIAIPLLVLFYVDWRQLGDIFNFPFAMIGSFSDVLSYIRLYAVGLASYYLAVNINQIGAMFFENWALSIIGILIILLGHSLNITLCLLGVLVHGVRLNALEFSNHMELQWKGLKYRPLKLKN